MGRAERRRMMRESIGKNQELIKKYGELETVSRIVQNGIGPDDLLKKYNEGFQEGFQKGMHEAGMSIVKCCYAGIIIALKEQFHFGQERLIRALNAVDEKIIYALNHNELADEALEKSGIEISFSEAFDRVQKKEGNGHAKME